MSHMPHVACCVGEHRLPRSRAFLSFSVGHLNLVVNLSSPANPLLSTSTGKVKGAFKHATGESGTNSITITKIMCHVIIHTFKTIQASKHVQAFKKSLLHSLEVTPLLSNDF